MNTSKIRPFNLIPHAKIAKPQKLLVQTTVLFVRKMLAVLDVLLIIYTKS